VRKAFPLCCCHPQDRERSHLPRISSDLSPSTFILLKVSTKTHCHSPYLSLSLCHVFPPFSLFPSSPPLRPTLPYCSFCARRQKICLPYTQGCLPVSHKVQIAWESFTCAINSKCVCVSVYILYVLAYSLQWLNLCVCVCTVNNACTSLCVLVALPLCLQGQVFSAWRACTFM